MRLNYYRFPEETPEEELLKNGCAIILKDGSEIYAESIPESKRPLVSHIDTVLSGISVRHAKDLLRTYGGSAWTEHCERDGGLFEVTDIHLSGNNSQFRYNRHL